MIHDDFNDGARSLALRSLLPNLLRNAARTLTFIYTKIILKRLLLLRIIAGMAPEGARRIKIKTGNVSQ
jgi:hypothetical protein